MVEKNSLYLPILEKAKQKGSLLGLLGIGSRRIIRSRENHIDREQNVQLETTNQRQVIGLVGSGDYHGRASCWSCCACCCSKCH